MVEMRTFEGIATKFPKEVKGFELVRYLGGRMNSNVFEAKKHERIDAIKIINGVSSDELHGEKYLFGNDFPPEFYNHIIRVHDVDDLELPGAINGKASYVRMEYLHRGSLEDLRDELNLNDMILFMKHAAMGLQAAHKMGILHMDIRLANLGVNNKDITKLMDFTNSSVKPTKNSLGTTKIRDMRYEPPETSDNNVPKFDERTDVWLYSATFYHLLTDVPPYFSSTLLKDNSDFPKSIVDLVESGLSPKMEDRPTIDKIIDDLDKGPGNYALITEANTIITEALSQMNEIGLKVDKKYGVLNPTNIQKIYNLREKAYSNLEKIGASDEEREIEKEFNSIRQKDAETYFNFSEPHLNKDYEIPLEQLSDKEKKHLKEYSNVAKKWLKLTGEPANINHETGEFIGFGDYEKPNKK